MNFTQEQLDYLANLLRPFCCHTTGMHDPNHFEDKPEQFCSLQLAAVWRRVVSELNINVSHAVSNPACGWCSRARDAAKAERSSTRLPPLEQVLTRYAKLSQESDPAQKKLSSVVQFDGSRVDIGFAYSHHLQDIGECAYIHLRLPRYESGSPIPVNGYPKKRAPLTEDEKTAITATLTIAGAHVLAIWGGSEWLSIGLRTPQSTETKS